MRASLKSMTARAPRARRSGLAAVVVGLALVAITAVTTSANAASSASLSVRQEKMTLAVAWKIRGKAPAQYTVRLEQAGKVKQTLRALGKERGVTFKKVLPGEYSVVLTAKQPTLKSTQKVAVYGAPLPPRDLSISRGPGTLIVAWTAGAATPYNSPTRFRLSLNGDDRILERTIDPATTTHVFDQIELDAAYELTVTAENAQGSSPKVGVKIEADLAAKSLTEPKVLSQADAEAIFGSFAMLNRPALGPTNLETSPVAAQNPALKALQSCITTNGAETAAALGLPNVGAVLATRSSTGTTVLTSGATALAGTDAKRWIDENSTLESCASRALAAQMSAVALQLSQSAKLSEVRPAVFDATPLGAGARALLLDGTVLLNGGTSGENPQMMQLLWIVVGEGETVAQYILIRVGTPLDAVMTARLVEAAR